MTDHYEKVISDYSKLLTSNDAGINCSNKELLNGSCSMNVNEVLWIKESQPNAEDAWLLVQDIVLSATTFIGTIVLVWWVVSAFMMIMWGFNGSSSMASNGKKWLWFSFLGFMLVASSYLIIRLVQFVLRG